MTEVDVTIEGPVLRINLNRPEKKNALTTAMYNAIGEGLITLEQRDDLRVGILSGAGPDFCAGNDIYGFRQPDTGGGSASGFIDHLIGATKPLIASVRGRAIGIGATMLLHCDLVYLSPSAEIRFPFVDLGLVPEAGSTALLPALVGKRRAAELFLLARPLGAARAAELGVANEVVPEDQLERAVADAAEALAAKPPHALRATKTLMRGDSQSLLEHSREELEVFRKLLDGPEFAAAVERFRTR